MILRSAKVELRRAIPEDAEVCGRIFYEAFTDINRKHVFAPEVPTVEWATGVLAAAFSHPGFHCQVAQLDKQILGSACEDERSPIVGIGPISVAPAKNVRFTKPKRATVEEISSSKLRPTLV